MSQALQHLALSKGFLPDACPKNIATLSSLVVPLQTMAWVVLPHLLQIPTAEPFTRLTILTLTLALALTCLASP